MASLSKGRTAAAQCGLFTHKSVPVIFEPPCIFLGGNTSCVPRLRICITCVPRCLLQVYQLRPELSTPSMKRCVTRLVRNCFYASQGVCFMHISGVPCRQPHAYELRRKTRVYKSPKICRFLLSFIVR